MIVGYSRVSTDGQTLYAQQAALRDTEIVDVLACTHSPHHVERTTREKV
jgi:DNA invertase Pin-like site-specific DNA recombinase